MSKVIVVPSRSSAVIVPDTALAPPIKFDEPSCSISKLKVAPT